MASIDLALKEIADLLGNRLSLSKDDRANHAGLESFVEVIPPEAVACVTNRDEVQAICKICTKSEPLTKATRGR